MEVNFIATLHRVHSDPVWVPLEQLPERRLPVTISSVQDSEKFVLGLSPSRICRDEGRVRNDRAWARDTNPSVAKLWHFVIDFQIEYFDGKMPIPDGKAAFNNANRHECHG